MWARNRAVLFACWCGPRWLVAAAAKYHDEHECGAGHDASSSGATPGGNGMAAHDRQDTYRALTRRRDLKQ
jgi:hypothetical protein